MDKDILKQLENASSDTKLLAEILESHMNIMINRMKKLECRIEALSDENSEMQQYIKAMADNYNPIFYTERTES